MNINMKRIGMLLAVSAALLLGGCVETGDTPSGAENPENGLSIVCTIFPEYDWVRQIMGDQAENAEISYLLANGADLHSFQPTAQNMAQIAGCDLFVYVGSEFDEWVDDALAEAVNPEMQVLNLLEVMGDQVKEEELKEGMEADEDKAEDEEEGPEYDEHVWLSVKNAKVCCEAIAEKLAVIDSENAAKYQDHLAAYSQKLDELDAQFQAAADGAAEKTLIFGDRFPFRYFANDYGFDYYAAFVGCSAETEASFETIVFLADKMDELGCGTIFTIESSDGRIAQTIIDNTTDKNQNIAVLNSLQSVTQKQITEGATYLSLMQENLEVLRGALNG